MFDKDKIYISELHSVVYVTPALPKNKRRISYSPNSPRHQLVCKLAGEIYTTYNGTTLHITPGTVYFLPKGQNTEYYVDRIELGDCIDILFDTDSPLPHEAFAVDCSSNRRMFDLYDKICRIWVGKQEGYYYKCMALFYEILAELSKSYKGNLPKTIYQKIEPGIQYLHAHCFDKELDYYMPAKLCEISYTYFKKLFKQKHNLAPIQYVTRLRLERSAELLITGHYSVTEVAEACGFENVFYFSRKFKEHYGVSPTNYSPH